MKILGVERESGGGTIYLCEVSHSEIEKFLNRYYNDMKKLERGDSIDLGKGYDFHRDTQEAIKKTADFINSNQKIVTAIIQGFTMLEGKGE